MNSTDKENIFKTAREEEKNILQTKEWWLEWQVTSIRNNES